MKQALFYTFLVVFGATALITLLGITGVLSIEEGYLDKLFYLLIAEAVAPVIALFKKTNFFDSETEGQSQAGSSKISVVLLPKESFPTSGDPHECSICVYDHATDEEREMQVTPIRVNGYLSTYLEAVEEHELIKVRVCNSNNQIWESEYFSPSIAKAEMAET